MLELIMCFCVLAVPDVEQRTAGEMEPNGDLNCGDQTHMTRFEMDLKDKRFVAGFVGTPCGSTGSHAHRHSALMCLIHMYTDRLQSQLSSSFRCTSVQVPGWLQAPGGWVWLLLLQEPPEGVRAPPASDQWAAGWSPAHDSQHKPLPQLLQSNQRGPG